jgi:selenocysteine lyase/cysteine desulfurase
MHRLEQRALRRVGGRWRTQPLLELLGPPLPDINSSDTGGGGGGGGGGTRRLPIVSFMIRRSRGGRYLHYNYVCALLNDLFGIQSRGGCACAGPYGLALLGAASAAPCNLSM